MKDDSAAEVTGNAYPDAAASSIMVRKSLRMESILKWAPELGCPDKAASIAGIRIFKIIGAPDVSDKISKILALSIFIDPTKASASARDCQ